MIESNEFVNVLNDVLQRSVPSNLLEPELYSIKLKTLFNNALANPADDNLVDYFYTETLFQLASRRYKRVDRTTFDLLSPNAGRLRDIYIARPPQSKRSVDYSKAQEASSQVNPMDHVRFFAKTPTSKSDQLSERVTPRLEEKPNTSLIGGG